MSVHRGFPLAQLPLVLGRNHRYGRELTPRSSGGHPLRHFGFLIDGSGVLLLPGNTGRRSAESKLDANGRGCLEFPVNSVAYYASLIER